MSEMGHNNPPSDAQLLKERLESITTPFMQRIEQFDNALPRVVINSPETAAKAAEMLKQINALSKALEEQRKAEKDPYLSLSRVIDAYYKPMSEGVTAIKVNVQKRLTEYQAAEAKKADEARRAAEAEAQRKLEEAQKLEQQTGVKNAMEAQRLKAEAEARLQDAKDTDTAVRSSSGATAALRTTYSGELASAAKFLPFVKKHYKEELDQWLQTMAQKAVRDHKVTTGSEMQIPGVKVTAQQTAVVR
ncbi:MAG: hypothetical protein MJH10_09405 [Epibacterium sp.]|nr:hypothetical protein [Epibacterium sp.]NQX73752.1 hypothetical protein [Epibacterium sp.]